MRADKSAPNQDGGGHSAHSITAAPIRKRQMRPLPEFAGVGAADTSERDFTRTATNADSVRGAGAVNIPFLRGATIES